MKKLIRVKFSKVMQTRSYTVVTMGNEKKQFAIYTEPSIGRTMQMHLTESETSRPLTHDLINMLFTGFNISIKQVIINDIQDTIYFARLFLEQKIGTETHILEIDARPSDCITLAMINDIPVYCTEEVLEKSIPVQD